jgi:DnaD/phage-associated family protein
MTGSMEGFGGFPAGKQATTPVPNQFFSELLPLVDHLAELKVTLHLFWLIGKKRGALRYARLTELQHDERLLAGLTTDALSGAEALNDALERAVARGSLLHVQVERDGDPEDWYMVNSANGRAVLEQLRSGDLDLLTDTAEDIQLQDERPTIFTLYEQNIGMLTPMITDELRDAERRYPAGWIADAFREAALMNKRNWKYIVAILERWRVNGRSSSTPERDAPDSAEARLRRQVLEGYEDLIEH